MKRVSIKTLSALRFSMPHAWRALWIFCAVSVFSTLILPTRWFYNPSSVEIEGYTVRVYRTFPMDALGLRRPIIRYVETVTSHDGMVCSDSDKFRYSAAGEFGAWDIEAWAVPCMTGRYVWHAEWTAYFLGVFPMRPVTLNAVFFGGAGT